MNSSLASRRVLRLIKLARPLEVTNHWTYASPLWSFPRGSREYAEAARELIPPGRYLVTVTDNVLDAHDWSVVSIEVMDDGCVRELRRLNEGSYGAIYADRDRLLDALYHDPTGTHPEVYVRAYYRGPTRID